VLRCLMEFYGLDIPLEVQPSLALAVETEELSMAAGLQDRVIQVYEGLVFMDFAQERQRQVHGFRSYHYERLDPSLLPPLYVAFSADVSKPVQLFHNNIRERYHAGDPAVLAAMRHFADLTVRARDALLHRDAPTLHRLMNENFDTRRSLYQLPREQIEVVEAARSAGASAKFAGSGGAIVGTYTDAAMFHRLQTALGAIHCQVLKLN
jgi:glucuronokinase